MEHKISKVKVYCTDDYKLFKMIDGNRNLDKKKIERIISEIKAGNDILDEVPILVKEEGKSLRILEGQHRFKVAERLGRTVHYILHKENMSLYSIAKINSNTEKWKAIDFINCYTKAGNSNYEKINHLHKKYGISVGVCLSLLKFGYTKNDGGHDELKREFETGIFEVKKNKEAIQIAELCKSFEKFPAWNSRGFIMAVCRLLQADKCSFDVLLKKFLEDPSKLQQQANYKGYLTNLEEIYNRNNSKRRTIY
jgi:hypothetical protein